MKVDLYSINKIHFVFEFQYQDMGTILLGKIESGEISKGSSLVLMPNKTPVEVLTILVDDDERNSATAGDNVKVKVRGVEEDDVSSGFVLCDTINPCHTGREFIAQVSISDSQIQVFAVNLIFVY
ncbi:eukaryotic peptide chain release factor GTP-binding subunit ERF3A-like [Anneissia japonica]|uniref:eukaryotic peptide chain release factor GTP-binding subunit ERF3A-like n=1 Tax=Anneissia japonica TaxID=1529436 RepID=UPI001425739C|nr:eukaryotic peptide chain release factor GTP-binding subunit ERF3A-like [Anneissia japonica]